MNGRGDYRGEGIFLYYNNFPTSKNTLMYVVHLSWKE
jgi:hypothetical protein